MKPNQTQPNQITDHYTDSLPWISETGLHFIQSVRRFLDKLSELDGIVERRSNEHLEIMNTYEVLVDSKLTRLVKNTT